MQPKYTTSAPPASAAGALPSGDRETRTTRSVIGAACVSLGIAVMLLGLYIVANPI